MELEGWDFPEAAYIASLCQFQLISLPRQYGRGWQYPQLGLPSTSARSTTARQGQQAERKRRECPSPQAARLTSRNWRSRKDIPCICSCVRVSRSGHFWRSCVWGKAPPPCSPFLRNGARGSPTHSCGSGTDLPPVTPEQTQGMSEWICLNYS